MSCGRIIHITSDTYGRLDRAAWWRGVSPDALADELITAELPPAQSDLEGILVDLAEIRGRVRAPVDAVAVVRESHEGQLTSA
jgi:hypothetical protein